jgi:HlyD family secretion protein
MVDSKNNGTGKNSARARSVKIVGAIVIIAAIGLAAIWLKVVRGGDKATRGLEIFVVERGPLTISVKPSGTIKPQETIILRNEVEGRTSIVKLIAEGTIVKAGEVLVELDASTLKDLLIDQEILKQKAEAAFIGAQESLEVAKNQAQSNIEAATLTLKFAQQDLDQYEKGIYPKDVNELTAKIRLAEENVKRAEDVNQWSETLYKEKYLSETEYLGDKLAVQQRRLERDVAMSNLDLLVNFTYHRQIEQLTSNVSQAKMALERTERKATADVIQAKADLAAKDLEYKRQQDKYKKNQDQLDKTVIIAPIDGMVVYATSAGGGRSRSPGDRREPMDIGVEVTERQDLIALPTATSMKAEVSIHEASLEKVRVGLPAVITLDALPGKKFIGKVVRIAPLPDPQSMWMNPDLKVYNADVYLEGSEPALRAGMGCKVEIIVEQYDDAVYVPVQTVLRVGGEPTVFVIKDGSIQERKVEVGLDNDIMIRIISGLKEGEAVWMTPPLKSATVEPGSQMEGIGSGGATEASDALKRQISERLDRINGTETGRPAGVPSDDTAGAPDQLRGRPMGQSQQGEQPQPGPPGVSPQQMERMRQRFENMSPEERQKEMERMKQRFENMSPQERERMRQRDQDGAGREGRGTRQRGAERNQ